HPTVRPPLEADEPEVPLSRHLVAELPVHPRVLAPLPVEHGDKMGTVWGNKVDKSEQFAWTMGETGAPLIDEAKVSIECEVDGNYELEHFATGDKVGDCAKDELTPAGLR
ncbi:MAG: hypothetical protein IKG22_11985, partial [Atopobiaceae bacterium]|nr:hypothetical protein [Atopobiaceae bacterium]